MILSIDCGIKNLAMCLIDSNRKIVKWDVSGIPPNHKDGLFPCMVRHLDTKTWTLDATTVVIEKQPGQNKGMKGIEHLLHTYFLVKGKDVVIWDARFKVPDCAGTGKAMYAKRKAAAVKRAREFIAGDGPNKEWVSFFDGHKKKDDLADTVMQALSYIDRKGDETGTRKPKKVVPRKPTENQTRIKYSKANLAWLVKSGAKQDARFKKDLARYYSSIDELKSEFNI
jgi:Poxvirus A22 protein